MLSLLDNWQCQSLALSKIIAFECEWFFCFWIVSTLLQKYPSSFEKVWSWTILQFCWMKICFWLLHLMTACNCCINEQNWRLIKKIRPKRGSLDANTFREQHKVLKSWKPKIGEIFEHWQDVLTKNDPSDLYLHVWLNDAVQENGWLHDWQGICWKWVQMV